jgi:hypothetical protein
MAAPTLSAYSNSPVSAQATKTTGSVSWTIGDTVLLLGGLDDNSGTFSAPSTTGTGLTFAAISGFPTNVASNTKLYAWSATASASSSGTMSSNTDSSGRGAVLAVLVYSGSDGLGNNAKSAAADTTDPYTVSLTRAGNNSAVAMIASDWNAISDAANDPSPSTGSTERIADNAGFISGLATFYLSTWADEGTAGTTSYGITGVAGCKMLIAAIEVKGSAGGGAAFIAAKNTPIQQAVKRASYW